jgi:ATP-dependent DNA helicase RecG
MLIWQTLFTGLRRRTPQEAPLAVDEAWLPQLFGRLPYTPTGAQMRCIREIIADLTGKTLMTRLVQGDVGCGKTLIAIAALYLVARSGAQAVLMAPTEILAQQHCAQVCRLLEGSGIRCGLLVGSLPAARRREVRRQLAEGELSLAVGTHALLSEEVRFRDLRLVITDEQHRFGARQRTILEEKGDRTHVLVMSATPIPRTLSMVLFGDLDLSVVDELPPGRMQVRTRIVPEERREAMYAFIRERAAAGQQAYVVCRLIGKDETEFSVHSALSEAEHLRGVLAPVRVGLVHGKMKREEQEEVLRRFREKDIQVLVATTVIEVGVDVPDATIMVIEDAASFGLAQLHQLRGRVGRGNLESWCFLMAEKNERLACLCATSNGFEIAETDLRLRGAGEYFGAHQHGQGRFPAELFTGDSAAVLQAREAFEILRDRYPKMLEYLQFRAREYAASEGILTSVN